jgi:hypothetical protein
MGKGSKHTEKVGVSVEPLQSKVLPSKLINKYIRTLKVSEICRKLFSMPHSTPLVALLSPHFGFLQEHLLQPSNKHYNGMGYAKESVFLQLDDPDYDAKFVDIWEEHVPGFSGKVRVPSPSLCRGAV